MSLEEIQSIVGDTGYLENESDMAPYLEAWRGGHKGRAALVVFPQSTQQVAAIVKICAGAHIPIVPQGGNTGLVGGSVPDKQGNAILISLSRMNNIREIDPLNYTMTAEAGCILENIQQAAEEKGRLFPLSMASEGSAQVGGILSTNAGGTAVLRYGNTRELTLGIEAVLPDGSIYSGLRSLRKDNTGYDLKQLLIGAEGTLGIITAATFKLFPLPKTKETSLLAIPDLSSALSLLSLFRKASGDTVNAFELISDTAMQMVLAQFPDTRAPFKDASPYYLLVELSSSREQDGLRDIFESLLTKSMEEGLITNALMAESLAQAQDFWFIREHISEAERKAGRGIHFDISVPVSGVASFMERTDEKILSAVPECRIVSFGHVSDGNIHYNMSLPKEVSDFMEKKKTLKTIVYEALKKCNGSISAEHGIGVERRDDLKAFKPKEEMDLMRTIKHALDPDNIMNPGKIFHSISA